MCPSRLPTHWEHLATQMDLVVKVSLESEHAAMFEIIAPAMHRLAEGFREIADRLRREEA